jgi:lysophospholipase L1-like esterase
VAVALVAGGLLAVAGMPLGVYEPLACAALDVGCAPGRPAGELPSLHRLGLMDATTAGGYLSLGDSYSSGEGAYDDTDKRSPLNQGAAPCRRSHHSYAPLVAAAYPFAEAPRFWACSGETTADMTRGRFGDSPQLDRVTPDASLVTLSLGGNDAGFTEVLTNCIAKLPGASDCVDQDAQVRARIERLAGDLREVLTKIRAHAPKARIIVVGYPRPFPSAPDGTASLTLSEGDQRWLNGMTRLLDDTIGRVVRDLDWWVAAFGGTGSVEFVDAYDAFDGHEVGTADPYVNGLMLHCCGVSVDTHSYHPTAKGYRRLGELTNHQIAAGPGRPLNNVRVVTR